MYSFRLDLHSQIDYLLLSLIMASWCWKQWFSSETEKNTWDAPLPYYIIVAQTILEQRRCCNLKWKQAMRGFLADKCQRWHHQKSTWLSDFKCVFGKTNAPTAGSAGYPQECDAYCSSSFVQYPFIGEKQFISMIFKTHSRHQCNCFQIQPICPSFKVKTKSAIPVIA